MALEDETYFLHGIFDEMEGKTFGKETRYIGLRE